MSYMSDDCWDYIEYLERQLGGPMENGFRPECAPGTCDFRVDPHVILTSNPPRQRLVCADCGRTSSRLVPGAEPIIHNNDVRSWEKVTGVPINDDIPASYGGSD